MKPYKGVNLESTKFLVVTKYIKQFLTSIKGYTSMRSFPYHKPVGDAELVLLSCMGKVPESQRDEGKMHSFTLCTLGKH